MFFAMITCARCNRKKTSWIWPAYYVLSIYWIISGIEGILRSLNEAPFGPGAEPLALVMGAFSALVGLGLLVRLEFLRGVGNLVCFLQILGGVLGLWTGVLSIAVLGPMGLIVTIMAILDVLTGGFMIYLIGETDGRSIPNPKSKMENQT